MFVVDGLIIINFSDYLALTADIQRSIGVLIILTGIT